MLKTRFQRLQSGVTVFSKKDKDYKLDDGKGDREKTVKVSFAAPFDKKPTALICLTGLDVSNSEDYRLKVSGSVSFKVNFLGYRNWNNVRDAQFNTW